MGLGTMHQYLERAVAAGIGWPLPEGLSEEELEAKLFGNQPVQARAVRPRPQPDWKTIHEQLQQHRHLTLQLVWEEYRQAHPEGYRYSWFCERYQHCRQHLDVVLRQEHKAGEKMFVDWAGATIPVYDATTGKAWPASLFVAVLGASSYTYAEATCDQHWKPGSRRTSTRWNFLVARPAWRCRITRRPPSPEPAVTIPI
jgi:transposase